MLVVGSSEWQKKVVEKMLPDALEKFLFADARSIVDDYKQEIYLDQEIGNFASNLFLGRLGESAHYVWEEKLHEALLSCCSITLDKRAKISSGEQNYITLTRVLAKLEEINAWLNFDAVICKGCGNVLRDWYCSHCMRHFKETDFSKMSSIALERDIARISKAAVPLEYGHSYHYLISSLISDIARKRANLQVVPVST
ncbi:MAG TPA: hypothetical protein PLF30_02420 [Candidatus Moranbacteria bacterium]|nr:hypothetical protein [Candidatus Moranbacteria bacterium]